MSAPVDFPPEKLFRSPDAEETTVASKLILFHRSERNAIVLNGTAATLWRCLETPKSSVDLAHQLAALFPAAPGESLERDVDAFIEQMRSLNFLLPPRSS